MDIARSQSNTNPQKIHTVKSASCLSENSLSDSLGSFSETFNTSRRSSLASCKLECSILDQIKVLSGSNQSIPRKGAFLVDTTEQPAEMLEASKSLLEIQNSSNFSNSANFSSNSNHNFACQHPSPLADKSKLKNIKNIPKIQVMNYSKHLEDMDSQIKQPIKHSPPTNIVSATIKTKRVGRFRITRIDEMHISQRKSEITHPLGVDKIARISQLEDNISTIN